MAGLEEHILTLIKNFLTTVGYPGVFLLMAIEGFGIPIPSEITMPFSGFLATAAGGSKFSLPVAIAVGSVGELAGGIFAYFLGYFGGRPILERYGKVVLLRTEELEKAETWFSRYGDWVVLVTRLLPAIRSFIALPAGVVRMPFWRFLLYGAVGTVVWCTVLALIGHALGQHWQTLGNNLRKYDVVILIAVVLLIVFAIYKRLTAGRGEIESEPEQAISADT
jgi:membrane protein DedA with SNARE-associated domain